MTSLFPSLGDPKLIPYEAPFGRMMLAYGRVIVATIALVMIKESEARAVLCVTEAGTKNLPKRVRRLLRSVLSHQQLEQLNEALNRLKTIAEKRHRLIHGEWWFNVFQNEQLEIRSVRPGRLMEPFFKDSLLILDLRKAVMQ